MRIAWALTTCVAIAACASANQSPPTTRPYAVNFIPFGAGQFQNGQRAKGVAFAVAEGAAAATSVGIWFYLLYSNPHGIVIAEDARSVRTLQQIEITTGVVFFGAYAWGVVDAIIHYRPPRQLAPTTVAGAPGLAWTWSN